MKPILNVRGRLCVSSVSLAHRAALGGGGIANIPRVLCEADVRQGRLVRLLERWTAEPSDLLVVYPSNRFLSPRVRNFVEALVARYPAAAEHGGTGGARYRAARSADAAQKSGAR